VRAHLRSSQVVEGEDVVVCLGPGIFDLSAVPLALTADDSPTHGGRVVWRGADTVLSGGLQVRAFAVRAIVWGA
jgi:hypothetical protein